MTDSHGTHHESTKVGETADYPSTSSGENLELARRSERKGEKWGTSLGLQEQSTERRKPKRTKASKSFSGKLLRRVTEKRQKGGRSKNARSEMRKVNSERKRGESHWEGPRSRKKTGNGVRATSAGKKNQRGPGQSI